MLLEARFFKGDIHAELASLIATRDRMVKMQASTLSKAHRLLNRYAL